MGFSKDAAGNIEVSLSKAPNAVLEDSDHLIKYVVTTVNTGHRHGLTLAVGGGTPQEALSRMSDILGRLKVIAQTGVDLDMSGRALSNESADAVWRGLEWSCQAED